MNKQQKQDQFPRGNVLGCFGTEMRFLITATDTRSYRRPGATAEVLDDRQVLKRYNL